MGEQALSVDELEPGMILARKIVGQKGNLIAGKGIELTDRIIGHLKRFVVKRVFVECDEEEELVDPAVLQKQIDELEKGIESRFRKVIDIPAMMKLKDILLRYMKMAITQKSGA